MTTREAAGHQGFPAGTTFEVATSAQRGLWLTQQLEPTNPSYLISHAFEIAGRLNADALDEALRRVVNRHDSLRTAFVQRGENLFQAIHPLLASVLDRRRSPEDLATALALDRSTTFSLSQVPLFSARLWQTGAQRHVLSLTFHHIIVDGVSVDIILREISVIYLAIVRGGLQLNLPELPLTYTDFAAWENEWLETSEYRRQLDHRVERLRIGPPAIDLPSVPSAEIPFWRGSAHERWLGECDTSALLQLARAHQATPFMALLLIFTGVLYRWSGQPDIIVGAPMSIRDQPGLENVVGMLVNTVAMRIHWGDDPTTAMAFERVSTEVSEAMVTRHVPFERLAAGLPQLRAPGRSPVVQVMLGYEDCSQRESGGLSLHGTKVQPLHAAVRTAKFDLSLDCQLIDGRLRCVFEWSHKRINIALMDKFVAHFVAAVQQVTSHTGDRVGEWTLHDPAAPQEPEIIKQFGGDPISEPWVSWCAASARSHAHAGLRDRLPFQVRAQTGNSQGGNE